MHADVVWPVRRRISSLAVPATAVAMTSERTSSGAREQAAEWPMPTRRDRRRHGGGIRRLKKVMSLSTSNDDSTGRSD
jgi:hypothetical protein